MPLLVISVTFYLCLSYSCGVLDHQTYGNDFRKRVQQKQNVNNQSLLLVHHNYLIFNFLILFLMKHTEKIKEKSEI